MLQHRHQLVPSNRSSRVEMENPGMENQSPVFESPPTPRGNPSVSGRLPLCYDLEVEPAMIDDLFRNAKISSLSNCSEFAREQCDGVCGGPFS